MQVNGEKVSVHDLKKATLISLLDYFNLLDRRVAIEHNGEIIKHEDYNKVLLKEEDKVEIIHFVGGG